MSINYTMFCEIKMQIFANSHLFFNYKVCELDIIFNFEKAHFVWNELVVSGEFMDSSRRDVIEAIIDQDDIQAVKFFLGL